MKTPSKRHRTTPEVEFDMLVRMVTTLNTDHAAKVQVAKTDRGRCAALKQWEAALGKYETKLARYVSERLGHASVAITLDRYSHVLPGMDRTAADALARLYAEARGA